MKMMKGFYLAAILLIGVIACQNQPQEDVKDPGINLVYMDTTIDPGVDFYNYVNGGWMSKTEIPADRSRWGSFNELANKTSQNTLKVLEEAMNSGLYEEGTDQAKAALFYKVAMDTAYLDQLGMEPVLSEIEKIDQIGDLSELKTYLAESAPLQNGYFFELFVMADFNDSKVNSAYLGSGSLGLPERDYYLNEDEDTREIQEKYKKHVARMFGFLDYSDEEAVKMAEEIFDLEKQMASTMLSKEESRNPTLLNNPKSLQEMLELTPVIDWQDYFDQIQIEVPKKVIVTDVGFFGGLNEVIQPQNLPVLKKYLKWTAFNESAAFLDTNIELANFDFYGKVLEGTEKMKPRSERILDVANWQIGEAIGKLYVDKYFPPEAKSTAEEMVDNIKYAMGERIKDLPWMSDSTKEKALHKLSKFTVKIGYPDEWEDYSKLIIQGKDESGSYYQNMVNIAAWHWQDDLAKIGKPVNKKEWEMAPQIVNAYYNPMNNEIVFPAAILQPPFYNYKADPAVNYGGIGAVIGHEISHGFDDQGSRFDAEGNLSNWWTDKDRERFEERTKLLVDQFNAYEPLEGVHINGEFTLGENIGDLGGVNVAYDALQKHLNEHETLGKIDGYTQDQRFFISWATIWRTKTRDEALKTLINTDPHSPGEYRAFAPLSNIEAFYEAFDVDQNDALFRPDSLRVYIW